MIMTNRLMRECGRMTDAMTMAECDTMTVADSDAMTVEWKFSKIVSSIFIATAFSLQQILHHNSIFMSTVSSRQQYFHLHAIFTATVSSRLHYFHGNSSIAAVSSQQQYLHGNNISSLAYPQSLSCLFVFTEKLLCNYKQHLSNNILCVKIM